MTTFAQAQEAAFILEATTTKRKSNAQEKAFILAAIAAQKAQGTIDYAVARKAFQALRTKNK